MTDVQRLAGIVVSPTKTFEDINLQPSWVLPVALLLIVNFVGTFVVYRVLITDTNFEQMARAKIQWDASAAGPQKSQITAEQRIEALRRQRQHWYVVPLIALPLSVLPLSALFYIILRLAKAGTTFRKVFAVVCWAFVIYRCIGGVVTIAALLVRGPANFFPGPAEAWSPTSLAQVVARTSVSPNAYSAISKLDVFLMWWLALMAVGFSKISNNLSIAKSAAIIAVTEMVYLVINAAGWLAGTL